MSGEGGPTPGRADPEWFPLWRPLRAPRARLLCLPCAGGGASLYQPLAQALAVARPDLELLTAQLPGREHRIRQRPFVALQPLLADLQAAVGTLPDDGVPLGVLGHSLGALVGFALCRELAAAGRAPRALFAAGARAPHTPPRRLLHELPLATLLDELLRLGGTDPRVLAERELVALLEPALRADLRIAETTVLPAAPALPLPIVVFGGDQDPHVPPQLLLRWREVAGAACSVELLAGGHFFVRDQATELAARLDEHLAVMLG